MDIIYKKERYVLEKGKGCFIKVIFCRFLPFKKVWVIKIWVSVF